MAREEEELAELRSRIEALEQLCVELRGRIAALEAAAAPTGAAGFHMTDEEPTV